MSMASMGSNWSAMRSMSRDRMKGTRLKEGTARRVLRYALPYRGLLALFLLLSLLTSGLVVATPILLGQLVDRGVIPGDRGVVIQLACVVAGLAVLDVVVALLGRWTSSRIGESLIYDMRTQVFSHVLAQPIGFFTRAQTGALVTRLNSDVIGAQQAFTSVLGSTVSNLVSVVFILAAMASTSWQLTIVALLLTPVFLVPARLMGRRLADLQRESMGLNAELGTRMTERFNVAGALLVKLFGRPDTEAAQYAARAGRVRDIGVTIALNRSVFLQGLTFVAALATAVVYGLGGLQAIDGTLTVGSLLALAALLGRLYAPLTALSNVRVDIMTALVSFERVFEILDLEPLVREIEQPKTIPDDAPSVEFADVTFGYPGADQISLTSLERGGPTGDRAAGGTVLRGVTFRVEPGQLVALVGPSGAGKTTITALVARLYDPTSGSVRLSGIDLREASSESLRSVVGMVTQESHLFHDTIRANLEYARPDVSEPEIWDALEAAQVRGLVEGLPQGLDTIVGDRGHRLSGGEKQRIAIARLLLKSPGLVVLDEATAHLDSESEAAVQRALDTALHGRTAMVIAHRLSTVRGADVILVVEGGRIVESGTHAELLARGALYADLYRTQFAGDD